MDCGNRRQEIARWRFPTALFLMLALHASVLEGAMVMTLGDSNTAGGADAYPGLLQQELDTRFGSGSFEVVNRGINGLTASGLVHQLSTNSWLDEQPDVVLLMIGGNDLAALMSNPSATGFFQVIEDTFNHTQTAVNLIRNHGYSDGNSPKIIVSAYIPNNLPNVNFAGLSINPNFAISSLNTLLSEGLQNADLYFEDNFEDIRNPVTGKANVNLIRDSIHLNQAGRQIVAENFANIIGVAVPELSSTSLLLVAGLLMLPRFISRPGHLF